MTDLHTRFQSLDALRAPDLWSEVEQRAMAMQPRRRSAWVLIAVTLLLALVIGGAVLVGSGVIKLPITVDASASPSSATSSSSAQALSSASTSPVLPILGSWTATGAMLEARTNHTATQLVDGRVLVVGGMGTATGEGFANILSSAEVYDPSTGTWTTTGVMLGARAGHTATLLPDGKVLVAGGGSSGDGDGGPLASAELYDPSTGTWTATGSTIGAGPGRTATLLGNGKVLVVGGAGANFEPVPSAELYDPSTGSWSAAAEMADARSGPTATLLLGGKVLVAGGSGDGGLLSTVEVYDPSSDSWTATGAMLEHNVGHTATLVVDGRVLVAGGGLGTSAGASAELYDPTTGQWSASAAMPEGRIYHTATLLPGGRVLVADGANGVVDAFPSISARLYDPGTGSWSPAGDMLEARGSHTATLLLDGRVLVAGGALGTSAGASAELYDPGSPS